MSAFRSYFSGSPLDRSSLLRGDPEQLAAARDAAGSRFVVIWQRQCLIVDTGVLTELGGLAAARENAERITYLGSLGDDAVFALHWPGDEEPEPGLPGSFSEMRALIGQLDPDEAAIVAYAQGMLNWQQTHRYCGRCGTPNERREGGFVMGCPACGHKSFPRLDPAIITLVEHEDRCLLGRQVSWPEGRYSTIAGFVEPGESLEDAVRREVREETDVVVGDCSYLGSQPWPFPNALMLGFHAEAKSTAIHRNDGELADARWFTREQLAAGEAVLPPSTSIAWHLIQSWFDREPGWTLEELDLSGSFTRAPKL